jgi:hypothetical protein
MARSLKPDLKVGAEAAFGGERPLKRPAGIEPQAVQKPNRLRGHSGIPEWA